MDKLRMKVCGMRETENILAVADLKPDFMGFIFYPGTPRFVGNNFALPPDLSPEIKRVGVFVNAETEAILGKVQAHQLDYVQLHGGETPEQCQVLKRRGVGVIKVFSVDEDMDFTLTKAFTKIVDYFLFDAKGKLYGGNAKRFNWRLLDEYDQEVPFFLSGGITPEHIGEIKGLRNLNVAAIDVNSGVEIHPGYKDINKIKAVKAILDSNH